MAGAVEAFGVGLEEADVVGDGAAFDPLDFVGLDFRLRGGAEESFVDDGQVGDVEEVFDQARGSGGRGVGAAGDGAEGGVTAFGESGQGMGGRCGARRETQTSPECSAQV